MKNVIIYSRVSTDEQAKGFSLEYQDEVLKHFCELNKYNIVGHYKDDESAKDFEGRPDWKILEKYVKSNKLNVDLILVHKWDRFARNVLEAYKMLEKLGNWGVEVNATEQWIDMNSHESKIMLSIYLAQGEVERLKISSRVKDGNFKALSKGCFINKAPFGYKNIRYNDNIQTLKVVEDEAIIVREIFKRIASGIESGDSVLKDLKKRGFKMSRSNYFRLLKKVVYIGKIIVPEFKKNPMKIVDGYHDAIVDIFTFQKVQNILNEKKWSGIEVKKKSELFPLRNFLLCSYCGENMTASSSMGRNKKYHYYHCTNKHRIDVNTVHQMFENVLSSLVLNDALKKLYIEIFKKSIAKYTIERNHQIKKIEFQIVKFQTQLSNADEKLLTDEITIETYDRMNNKLTKEISDLKIELSFLMSEKNPLEKYLDGSIHLLSNLLDIYNKSDYDNKRLMIGSIFNDKLRISKTECRTNEKNLVVELFSRYNRGLEKIKKETESIKIDLSPQVPRAGLEPARTLLPTGF